jgi:uncharacterized membrane protein
MIIELLSAAGFLIASYITYTLHNHGQLACPLGPNCNDVLEGKYGALLGINNATLGIFYYTIVFLVSIFHIPVPQTWALLVTGAAAAMAFVLLSIQALILRKWCDFCIGSNIITLAIFIVLVAA